MKLHRPSDKPEWSGLSPEEANIWQRLAMRTGGYVTPGNVITIVGFVLVLYGLVIITERHYFWGLVIVGIGRLLDILDGVVAESTRTKSIIGAGFDVMSDKLGSLATLVCLGVIHTIPWIVAVAILLPNIGNSLVTIWAKRRNILLLPSRYGKHFMACSWVSILLFVFAAALTRHSLHTVCIVFAYIFFAAAMTLGGKATLDYYQTVRRG